jgi:hypothetical protein
MNFTAPYSRPLTAANADRAIKNIILNKRPTACAVPTSYYQCNVEALSFDLDALFGAE